TPHLVVRHGVGIRLGVRILEALAGAADGEALFIEQIADPQHLLDVPARVHALVGAGVLGPEGAELGLPEAQDVRLHARELRDLADSEVLLVRNPRIHRRPLLALPPLLGDRLAAAVAGAALVAVEGVLEDLAGLEGEHAAGRDGDLLAGLRIATDAGLLVPDDEVTEARYLNLFAALERFLDAVEHG